MKKILLLIVISLSLLGASRAAAQFYPPAPRAGTYVADPASVLKPDVETYLNDMSRALEEKTTAQVAIAVVDSTSPETVEGYAVELFKRWGIGQAETDNGVLLVVAMTDRKMRIEVGYGLEGALTDIEANRIIDELMTPRFKQGDFMRGAVSGTEGIIAEVLEEYGMTHDDLPVTRPEIPEGRDTPPQANPKAPRNDNMPSTGYIAALVGGVLGVVILVLIVIWKMPSSGSGKSSGGPRWTSGGDSGGSSGGSFGGGGSSGGGGASGGW